MASRRLGGLVLDTSIETTKTLPLDARDLVRTKEERLDPESFQYGYKGMLTASRDEEQVYMLIDKDNPSQEASWKLVGPYDDSELVARVAALEQGGAGTGQAGPQGGVFVAEYRVTTAQELLDYLEAGPVAPIVVKLGDEYRSVIFIKPKGDNSVIVRFLGTLDGEYHVFDHTVTGSNWVATPYAFQRKLVSGTDIKTINGESLLGSGDIVVAANAANAANAPETNYEVCVNDVGGNVVQIGTIKEGDDEQNLYQFYYRTDSLANSAVKTHSFANLLADYSVSDFIDATGMTSDGIFVGNGRTDNDNRLVVQQFSKNNKNIQIRTYKDFSTETALIKVIFKGKKTA